MAFGVVAGMGIYLFDCLLTVQKPTLQGMATAALDSFIICSFFAFVSAIASVVKHAARSTTNRYKELVDCANIDNTNAFIDYRMINRGYSVGRHEAINLREQLALLQTQSNPTAGKIILDNMTDARWLSSEGWVKMQQTFTFEDKTILSIHYVINNKHYLMDDFKFITKR